MRDLEDEATTTSSTQPPASLAVAASSSQTRIRHCLLICVGALLCHGLLLTNDGPIWDGWYVLSWVETKNWAPLHEFFGAVGIPQYGWMYRAFSAAPEVVPCVMIASFSCLLGVHVLAYNIAIDMARINRSEAVSISLLSLAMPVFTAAQDLVMCFFLLTELLFFLGIAFSLAAERRTGQSHWAFRLLAVGTFTASFSNAALLVFYAGFWLLFLFHRCQLTGLKWRSALPQFLARYPELTLLPPAAWAARQIVTPQYGWYEKYNSPIENLARLPANFASFLSAMPKYHIQNLAHWSSQHFVVVSLLGIGMCYALAGRHRWSLARGPRTTLSMASFGGVLLVLAIFPYAAAGKSCSPTPVGDPSRYCILTTLPAAVLLFAAFRAIAYRGGRRTSRWLSAAVAVAVILLGCQIPAVYLSERAEWIFSRSLLHVASKNEVVRHSSIILMDNYSFTGQAVYGVYGFKRYFGDLTRLVSRAAPRNGAFYSPNEIETALLRTTVLPNEFNDVDPSGQQIELVAERHRNAETDAHLAVRYFALRHFGTPAALDEFLASLVTVKTRILKGATHPVQHEFDNISDGAEVGSESPESDFTNDQGMRFVRTPWGWWASRFETTQRQYENIMKHNPSLFKDPFRPVERVSWNDAVDFCGRLTELERRNATLPPGFGYRLPTLAEFDQLSTPSISPATAVTSDDEVRWSTAPIGSRQPNELGLSDVFGNVWEWCLDSASDPRFKVSKGGGWADHWSDLATPAKAQRLLGPLRRDYPDQAFWDRGFRCVLVPDPPKEMAPDDG